MEEEEPQEIEFEKEENKVQLDNPRSTKQFRRHPIVRDFDNESLIKGQFMISEHVYEDLREEAFKRRVTMGKLVRDALDLYLAQLKEEPDEGTEEHPQLREAIALVRSCNKESFLGTEGFEIAGEDGFIAKLEASNLDPGAWENNDLLEALAKRLALGYSQWISPPMDTKALFERVSNAMAVSDEKREVFAKAFSSALETKIEAENIEG